MKNKKDIVSIILAAGEGTRMVAKLPKVLHQISAKPMVSYILEKVYKLGIRSNIVVIGYQKELVKDSIQKGAQTQDVIFVEQKKLLGTGHAVLQAKKVLKNYTGNILVLCGDMPLLRVSTLSRLISYHRRNGCAATLLTAELPDPSGYGRILSEGRKIIGIVEEKNTTAEQKLIKEINTGAGCFRKEPLFWALKRVKKDKLKGEYYLTDAIAILARRGSKVRRVKTKDYWEALGVNSQAQLQKVEKIIKEKKFIVDSLWLKRGG